MTPEDKINKSRDLEKFNTEVLNEVFSNLKSSYVDKFTKLSADDVESMQEINRLIKNLEGLETELNRIIMDGKIAKKAIDKTTKNKGL